MNNRLLIPGVARHGTGSSPQSMLLLPGTDVKPRETPKSNTWKRSPASNTSVTVRTALTGGATKVQGGASRKPVGVPELGMQKGPAGSLDRRRLREYPRW